MIKNSINIMVGFDDGYLYPCATAITSLISNLKNAEVTLFYLYWENDINGEKRCDIFRQLVNYNNLTVIPLKINNYLAIDNLSKKTTLGPASLIRLVAPFFLPDYVNDVLYIDCDIIFQKNIIPLLNKAKRENEYVIIGAEEKNIITEQRKRALNIKDNIYLNSGFLFYNIILLKKLYKNDIVFINELLECNYQWKYIDQDIINKMFDNYKSSFNSNTMFFTNKENKYKAKGYYLLHYLSSPKPWSFKYYSYKYGIYYLRYAKKVYPKRWQLSYFIHLIRNTLLERNHVKKIFKKY